MSTPVRFTTADLEGLPYREGVRYEIIDGELHVSTQPHIHHQYAAGQVHLALQNWSQRTGAGLAVNAPGLVFAPDQNVAPDVVWMSRARLAAAIDESGHFRYAPELIVEVLSPGAENERRDRELKLSLYSRQGVQEYWIVDWRLRSIQVYRRQEVQLQLVTALSGEDVLTSPLLPGFSLDLSSLWVPAFLADS